MCVKRWRLRGSPRLAWWGLRRVSPSPQCSHPSAGCSIGWHAVSLLLEEGGALSLWLQPVPLADALHSHTHSHAELPATVASSFGPAAGIAVCGATVAAKLGLYWWTRRVAAAQRSQVLLANAWHHVSDSATSVVAAVGIAGASECGRGEGFGGGIAGAPECGRGEGFGGGIAGAPECGRGNGHGGEVATAEVAKKGALYRHPPSVSPACVRACVQARGRASLHSTPSQRSSSLAPSRRCVTAAGGERNTEEKGANSQVLAGMTGGGFDHTLSVRQQQADSVPSVRVCRWASASAGGPCASCWTRASTRLPSLRRASQPAASPGSASWGVSACAAAALASSATCR